MTPKDDNADDRSAALLLLATALMLLFGAAYRLSGDAEERAESRPRAAQTPAVLHVATIPLA